MKREDPLGKEWRLILDFFSQRFETPESDLEGILFLIGVNILGKGPEKFNKREKTEIMHLAVCELLIPYGYYERIMRDEDGWPLYAEKKRLPLLSVLEQEKLLKMAIINYFRQHGLIDCHY